MEYDVFISYSSEDGDVAQKVWAYLKQKGTNPWISPQCIPAGEPYARAIINGISKCRLMVVILSKASNSSDNVLNEVDQAHREGKVILPFIIDNTEMCGEMRYYLSRKQWINAYPEVTTAQCEQLFNAIRAYIQPNSEENLQSKEVPNEPQAEQQEVKVVEQKPEPEKEKNDVAKTMMEKFPEMELVPTSLYDWRKPKKSRIISIIFFIISLLPLTIFMVSLIDCATITWDEHPLGDLDDLEIIECDSVEGYHYYLSFLYHSECTNGWIIHGYMSVISRDIPNRLGQTEEELRSNVETFIEERREEELRSTKIDSIPLIITFFAFALPFLFLGWLFYVRYPKKGSLTLSSYANYIQKYRYKRKTRLGKKPQYVFFVKDHLFGVMNVADYKVHIPALYEKISWKEEGKLIRVTQDDHDFIIDINGEHLQ